MAPMVASTPVPRIMRRPSAASMRSSREARRSLIDALSRKPSDISISSSAACAASSSCACPVRARRASLSELECASKTFCARDPALSGQKLPALSQGNRPGDERSKRQADHHRLHDDMGGGEHAPGRQILGQQRGGGRAGFFLGRAGSARTAGCAGAPTPMVGAGGAGAGGVWAGAAKVSAPVRTSAANRRDMARPIMVMDSGPRCCPPRGAIKASAKCRRKSPGAARIVAQRRRCRCRSGFRRSNPAGSRRRNAASSAWRRPSHLNSCDSPTLTCA